MRDDTAVRPLVLVVLVCCLAVGAAGSPTTAVAASPGTATTAPDTAQLSPGSVNLTGSVAAEAPAIRTGPARPEVSVAGVRARASTANDQPPASGTTLDVARVSRTSASKTAPARRAGTTANGTAPMRSVRTGSPGIATGAVPTTARGTIARTETVRSTATLEIEAAVSGDSDSERVSFTFRVPGNENTTTGVSVRPDQADRSFGDVEFEFVGWTDLSGSDSGTDTSWTATGDHRYRVTYDVSATQGVDEGSYSITARATTDNGYDFSERIVADVELRQPEFGDSSGTTTDVTFDEDSGSEIGTTTGVTVPNEGDGTMILESASVGTTPRGISASVANVPDRVGSRGASTVRLDVTVDDTVEEGDHTFSVTVRDNLGHRATYDVTIRVDKVTALDVDSSVIDLGEVLVGQGTTNTVTIRESAGYVDVDNVVWEVTDGTAQGSISLSGLTDATVPAGESLSQQVSITVGDAVQQNEQLSWTVNMYPRSNPDGNARVTFTATVIYPPYYDGVSVGGAEFVFERPREEVSTYSETVTLRVRNGGDLPMDVRDIDPSVDDPAIDATVVDAPSTIDPRSSASVDVEVEAGPEATEGDHTLSVDVDAETAGSTTVTSSVSVDRRAELAVEDESLSFGEVIVTERASRATVLSETLGYEEVREFRFERVSGPDRGWLTVVERPSGIAPGESGDVVFAVQFAPNATLYETYSWTFRVSGTNVETQTITVSAVPRPIDFTQTRSELERVGAEVELGGEMAGEMNRALGSLEEKLQAGEAPRSDIVAVSTAGQSTVVFLESAAETRAALEAGNNSAAQRHLIRTSAAYRTLTTYTERIENDDLAERARGVTGQADSILAELTEQQRSYYERQLEADSTTMLERARIKRDLARLAALRGDRETARRLSTEADRTFANYSTLVTEGNERLQTGRTRRTELDESLFVTVFGQRVFWIGSLDRYESETQATVEHYEAAEQRFRTAGATERAEVAAEEGDALAASYQQARTVSLAIGGVMGFALLVVIVLEARALYRYVQESRAAVSGDFLV